MVDYDATGRQKGTIARLSSALGISSPIEEEPMTKGTAGKLIRQLYSQLRTSKRRELDLVVRPRRCKWCGGITERTRFGLCIKCGRFQ